MCKDQKANNIILTKQDRIDAYDKILVDDEEFINSFLEDNKKEDNK